MNKRTIYIFLSAIFAWSLAPLLVVFLEPMSWAIVRGMERSPYQYRVFWPHVYVLFEKLVYHPALIAWLFWFLLFALLAVVLDEYCRFWFEDQIVWGWVVLLMAVFAGIHHFEYGYDLWSLAEVLLIAVALLLLQRGQERWLIPVMLIAALNRETGGIIALLAYLATRRVKLFALLSAVWAFTYGAIRLYYGPRPPVIAAERVIQENLEVGSLILLFAGVLLFGWFFLLAWQGRSSAPPMARRVAMSVLVYLPFIAVFGRWQEWRLYMPLYPILLPLAIAATEASSRRPT